MATLSIIGSDDNNMHYWPVSADGTIGERKTMDTQMGSIREFYITDAIAEDFADLVIVNGFGTTRFISDKLNANFSQITSSKEYDNQAFLDFYDVSHPVDSVEIKFEGFNDFPVNAGDYLVNLNVIDPVYESSDTFNISITPRPLSVSVCDTTSIVGQPIPSFTLNYENFADGDDESALTVVPVVTTEATSESLVGEYDVVVSGGESQNYSFEYNSGILTIEGDLAINENSEMIIYPNPTSGVVYITDSHLIKRASIISLEGKTVELAINDGYIDLVQFSKGIYFLKFQLWNESYYTMKLMIQ
jgi:hypothetical protein